MIKICCVYFNDVYPPYYVDRLYDDLKRYCQVDFEFVCYSDTPDIKCDKYIPLPDWQNGQIKRHWHKLKFLDKEFIGDGDILIIDIDQIILKDITAMVSAEVKPNEILTTELWWSENRYNKVVNAGWYKFKSGTLKKTILDEFMKDPEYYQLKYYNLGIRKKYYGEQLFLYQQCIDNDIKVNYYPGEWAIKYSNSYDKETLISLNTLYCMKFNQEYMAIDNQFNENIKIIHFSDYKDYQNTIDEDIWT